MINIRSKAYINNIDSIINKVKDILISGDISMGKYVNMFENSWAEYCQCEHGVMFPNCSMALEASLRSVGVGHGDKVLVPCETFIATGMAVHLLGAEPIFTEINSNDFCMDFDDALLKIDKYQDIKAVIVVNFGGVIPSGMPVFVDKVRERGVFIIEDCAHSPGAVLDNKKTFGDISCYSFYHSKVMTCGEGGIAVTKNTYYADMLRSLQNRGVNIYSDNEQYIIPWRSGRVTEIQAVICIEQLKALDSILKHRRTIAKVYDDHFINDNRFNPLLYHKGQLSSYWKYILKIEGIDRNKLRDNLLSKGIKIDWPYDPLIHLQPVFRKILNTHYGMLEKSEDIVKHFVCLPINNSISINEAEIIANTILTEA